MLAVFLTLKTFLPTLRGHHVLVRSDNMTVVAFKKHQGGVRSHSLYRLVGTQQPALAQSNTCVRQIEHVGREAVHNVALPNIFLNGMGCPGPRLAQRPSLCFPPDFPATTGHQMGQGSQVLSLSGDPALELILLLAAASWPILMRKDLLSHARGMV